MGFKVLYHQMSGRAFYFVTDIEADGPSPLKNSMLSFASIAVRDDGAVCGEFEAVLKPLPDRVQDPRTMDWWATQPQAWRDATENARDASGEMRRFVQWVASLEGQRGLAARPLLFDGMWIDQYLRLFTDEDVFGVPHWGSTLFAGQAIDIQSYAMGVFGRTHLNNPARPIPQEWLGDHRHTHRAIDDARGYANLLSRLLILSKQAPSHPDDFFGH